MNRLVPIVATLLLGLTGCGVYREATQPLEPNDMRWQQLATGDDRDRLRRWRQAWTESLDRIGTSESAITANPKLFDPDTALPDPLPPAGDYRCRTYKLGAIGTATHEFTAYPEQTCRIEDAGAVKRFDQIDGAQRPSGLIFRDTSARAIFLGTLEISDEHAPLRYGLDARRDMIAYLERIDTNRWRLVFPRPRFESILDVVEIVPAG
jgi:hypothetical protein